ncbi:MAG: hypothetical protein WBD28_01745 [Candidatus Zixiibacteriota bacterium]
MSEFLEYDERIKKLKKIVDKACDKIKSSKMTLGQAKTEAALVRLKAEALIPEQMEKFDLIYGNRLKRLIQQYIEKKDKADEK